MPEQPQKLSTDTTLSVQQSMLGLPGRDLLDTLKLLLLQGLRQPMTSSHHLLQLSAQLLQVLLGRSEDRWRRGSRYAGRRRWA